MERASVLFVVRVSGEERVIGPIWGESVPVNEIGENPDVIFLGFFEEEMGIGPILGVGDGVRVLESEWLEASPGSRERAGPFPHEVDAVRSEKFGCGSISGRIGMGNNSVVGIPFEEDGLGLVDTEATFV